MQHTFYQALFPKATGSESINPKFKLFIACEDNAAFIQARVVENQVRALCGEDIEVSRVFWSFSLLRHPQLRVYASKEAADAQLLIISLSRSNELPPDVTSMLDLLPVRAQKGEAALVTLLSYDDDPFAEPPPALPYLRQLAENRGLDFFCNQSGWDRLEFSNPALERPDYAGLTPGFFRETTPAGTVSYHIPWSSWGINE